MTHPNPETNNDASEPMMSEAFERIEAMIEDNGSTWDLSINDKDALKQLLTAARSNKSDDVDLDKLAEAIKWTQLGICMGKINVAQIIVDAAKAHLSTKIGEVLEWMPIKLLDHSNLVRLWAKESYDVIGYKSGDEFFIPDIFNEGSSTIVPFIPTHFMNMPETPKETK